MGFPAPLSRDRKLRAEALIGGILGVEPEPCPAGDWGGLLAGLSELEEQVSGTTGGKGSHTDVQGCGGTSLS